MTEHGIKCWASGKDSVLTAEGDLRPGRRHGATLEGSGQRWHYLGHHQCVLETALVLRVWKTVQQDLVMGRFIPQGEAHPQLAGLQGLHGDVGLPQAACAGCRHRLGVRGGVCACVCPRAKLPQQDCQPRLPEPTHVVVIFILGLSHPVHRKKVKPLSLCLRRFALPDSRHQG